MHHNATNETVAPYHHYNVNLYIPEWLHVFLVIYSIVNLSLAGSTIAF